MHWVLVALQDDLSRRPNHTLLKLARLMVSVETFLQCVKEAYKYVAWAREMIAAIRTPSAQIAPHIQRQR